MRKDKFRILEQDTRQCMTETATNGIRIEALNCPELRGRVRKLFLRGSANWKDDMWLLYIDGCENFTNYLRALEEVVDSFVVCLR